METLSEKKAAFTVGVILDAAAELAQETDINELSFKRVSEHAGLSQRTMFRYFSTREAFLDALTHRIYASLALPDVPASSAALSDYIETLYQRLDAQPRNVMLLLSSDLFPRVIATTAKKRLASLQALLTREYPECDTKLLTKTAANLRYVMSASSWRYYRMHFEFDLQTSIECATLLVEQALEGLKQVNS